MGANADEEPAGRFVHWREYEGPRPVENGGVTVVCLRGREQVHPVVQDKRSGRLEDFDGESTGRAERNGVADGESLQFGNYALRRPAFHEVARRYTADRDSP